LVPTFVAGVDAAQGASVVRVAITRWALICGATAVLALAVLPSGAGAGAAEAQAPLFDLFGDNEIPHQIVDGIVGIGGDVMAFLMRMVPFPF
jgi:hypothetical protein